MPDARALLAFSLLIPLLAGAATPVRAQVATRVADLATDSQPDGSSSPQSFFTAGGKLFFSAIEKNTGRKLYVTDGTAVGTELLCPAICGSDPSPLAEVGGALVFSTLADDLTTRTLWRSDGTVAGTYPLPDSQGRPLQLPEVTQPSFTTFGGRLYVKVFGDNVLTVWQSDGTREGTAALPKLVPALPSQLSAAVAVAGKLFLVGAPPYPAPASLWTSDGTAAGTRQVTGLTVTPRFPTAAGDRLFFLDAATGQVWASDGTAAGTRQVSSFPGSHPLGDDVGFPYLPSPLRVIQDRLFFVADDVLHGEEIWTSDGTPGGTRRLTEFGYVSPFGRSPLALILVGNRLLFYADDGLTHLKLWTSDGTPETTAPLSDVAVDPGQGLARAGGKVIFVEASPAGLTDPRLWVTDGTPAGTLPLTGCPGPCATTAPLTQFGGAAYFALGGALWRVEGTAGGGVVPRRLSEPGRLDLFAADDPSAPIPLGALGGAIVYPGRDPAYGIEPFVSDGRPGGDRLLADINRSRLGSQPLQLAASGGDLFFTACPAGENRQLFHTAGPGATAELTTGGSVFCGNDSTRPLAVVTAGGAGYFLRDESVPYDTRIWKSDGTAAGTVALSGHPVSSYPTLAAFGGRLLFTADDPDGSAVWATDGTPQGTARVFVFPSGSYGIKEMTVLGNEIYLAVVEPDLGVEVWKSDGTQTGTRRLTNFASTASTVSHFVRAGSTVFFVANDRITGDELWKTDGTAAGTAQVVDLSPGFGGSDASDLTAFQGGLYFFARRPGEGRGLWRSDGTAAGTVRIHELRTGATGADAQPAGLTVASGQLFFTADDGLHGRELWKSDGTTAGTALVLDLQPGLASSRPANLTAAAGRLYFTADDGRHGTELWQSDGTAAGTRLVADVDPGLAPSSPDQLTVAGDRLYFTADDGETGRELWVLPLSGPAGCQPGDTRLCLEGGRFQVEIDWKDFQGHTGVGHAVLLTADTGYFWFFDPANVETVVKVLDARALNQAFWVFYGALSSVEYTMTVTDTATGLTRRYFNPSGQLASVGDTRGFGPLGAHDSKAAPETLIAPPSAPALVSARTDPRAATGSCIPAAGRLCLGGGRFAVTAAWKDFSGHTGTGTAVSLSGDTGYFWFFAPTNVEVIAKLLDGRALTGKFWFFYGALSNVEYTLTVTDTQTGAVKTYKNPSGQFGSVADTGAF